MGLLSKTFTSAAIVFILKTIATLVNYTCKNLIKLKSRFQPFPNRLYFFILGAGGRRVVLYRLYFSFCLSFSLRLVALFDSQPSRFT